MEEDRMTLPALRKLAELQDLPEITDDSLLAIGRELESFRSLLRSELRDRIVGAAELERADPLQVLALEEKFGAGECVERARAQCRRHLRVRGDARGGRFDRGVVGQRGRGGRGHRRARRYTRAGRHPHGRPERSRPCHISNLLRRSASH